MIWDFQLHKTYHRRNDIHRRYKGQEQSGISTPASCPGVFIFTGSGAEHVGYQDAFQADGSFRYTGQGQTGDMRMVAGNKAICEHVKNGKDLLLFQKVNRAGLVRFEGLFTCSGWEFEEQEDAEGNLRKAIVFTLVPQGGLANEAEDLATHAPEKVPFHTLRNNALKAVETPEQKAGAKRATTVYARSKAVRDYVLERSKWKCEHCHASAPFVTPQGAPYLEAHHILRLSDGGPDHPK
ncbi:MAG: hypothetical protein NF693_09055, partial [Bombella sp.]|nr:hypothetical protein [Bombella sp.]